jgi:ABC-type branched-subunit amino acid transport system substrate-binding protein
LGALHVPQDKEKSCGKNVLDGFTQQLAAMKVDAGTMTSYKRGATDFSAQIARMKADGCDLVVLGTIIRETIGAMTEAKKIGWTVDFLGAIPTNVLEVPALGKDVVEGLYGRTRHHGPRGLANLLGYRSANSTRLRPTSRPRRQSAGGVASKRRLPQPPS